jgi:hypothetical protein
MLDQIISAQAKNAYQAALSASCPDWRAVVELFRAAMRAEPVKRASKSMATAKDELADYNVDRVKLKCRSPRIVVRFMDGEAVFTHIPSAPGKPLNVGRALRVAIAMYRSRKGVQKRLGFCQYDRAIPVTEIFQVRCLETDELFDVRTCNDTTAAERRRRNRNARRFCARRNESPLAKGLLVFLQEYEQFHNFEAPKHDETEPQAGVASNK